MQSPKVSVIILNWNGRDDTLECLESVRQIDYSNFDIVVVDNGSTDDSVKAVRTKYPDVTVLETGENLGFAGGNNVGIRHALRKRSEYILLLNNDTTVDSQLLRSFSSASARVRQEAVFGAKIYFYSEPGRIWYAGGRWVGKLSNFIHVGHGCVDEAENFATMTETDYVCGCALFVNAGQLEKIGLFDERFFLTFEDTDLCYRAKKAGFKCFLVPDARVWHKVSRSFGGEESSLFNYFFTRNRLLWAEKNLPFFGLLALYRHVLVEVLRYVLPPRFRWKSFVKTSLTDRILQSLNEYRDSFRQKRNNPLRKARLWAVRDYFLRRFGNCPVAIKSLGK